jgi:tetratricopeptide (TPR) repeat protein
MTNGTTGRWKLAGISVGLIALIWVVFGQTLTHAFVNFDDESYVYANPTVSRGISPQAISWAFSHIVSHNWHPLTTISHMLDCQLFDLKPGGHHFTNVLVHTIATILLLIALYQMTGAMWRSAFVAAVFAIHPLHVESVAWIAERKDVLSAVFFMLTLIAYVQWTRKQSVGRYVLMSILFAGGLMSKPMLVTVPFVLLILDYWPLQRFQERNADIRKLLVEKLPLLILVIPVGVITMLIQRHGINSVENVSLPWRIGNALVSICIYLRQLVWPTGLAVLYPHLGANLPVWEIAIAIALTIALTIALFVTRKNRPWLWSGWLWYLVMLVPVIGIIQVGSQAHADRYSYLPQIGLYVAIAWLVADVSRRWSRRNIILTAAATLTIVAFACLAWRQAHYWRDSEALWTHTLNVTESAVAHERLASALLDKNRVDESVVQAQLAINLDPSDASAQNDFGVALARKGQLDAALTHFLKALEADPNLPRLQYNIANALASKGDSAQAKEHYERQLQIDPSFAEAHNNLANLFLHEGRFEEAAEHLRIALQLKPSYAEAHNNLAVVLAQRGQIDAAVQQWTNTLSIDPDNLDAHCNLAWVLATFPDSSIRNGAAALDHAERALRLSGGSNARIWRLVAAANAEMGRFDVAITEAERALQLAQRENNSLLVQTLESNIVSFRGSTPLRDDHQRR